jgi:hypothetical protein
MEKLANIFERTMLDWVLDISLPVICIESVLGLVRQEAKRKVPLDMCPKCREETDGEQSRAVCDRCDARFHWSCVSRSQLPEIKGDWFCPHCIKRRSVGDVHPCVGRKVIAT